MKPFTNTQSMRSLLIAFLCMFIFSASYSQSFNQTISGQVIDKDSKQALCGVELIIKNSDPIISAVTNDAGFFKFEDVPNGRFYVQASYSDYEYQPINMVDIFSGKSEVLCIELASNNYLKKNKRKLKAKIKELITALP